MMSGKWRPFYLYLNVLTPIQHDKSSHSHSKSHSRLPEDPRFEMPVFFTDICVLMVTAAKITSN